MKRTISAARRTRHTYLSVRLSEEERELITAAASQGDERTSVFARHVMIAAARARMRPASPSTFVERAGAEMK